MDGFLDYLDDFNKKQQKVVSQPKPAVKKVEEQDISKPKVLCMNVEIRTVEGAQKVIDKLQEWISKQESKEHFELKETTSVDHKYQILPKKIVQSPIKEAKSHAVDILNGLPDDNIITEEIIKSNINTSSLQNKPQIIKNETVAGHASALL